MNYGYKKFSVLNLEKGSIVWLESIFESVKSKYKCSLRLSNGLDYGIIFQLKVNKLRPYIINKMKICFSTNYNMRKFSTKYGSNIKPSQCYTGLFKPCAIIDQKTFDAEVHSLRK